jgi:hypothetical protein
MSVKTLYRGETAVTVVFEPPSNAAQARIGEG